MDRRSMILLIVVLLLGVAVYWFYTRKSIHVSYSAHENKGELEVKVVKEPTPKEKDEKSASH